MSLNCDEKTMTECETVSEQIFEFACGELSSEDASVVEKHVSGCEKCTAELENARKMLELIGESRATSEKSVAPAVMARIKRMKFAARIRSISRISVAAAVMLIVSVAVLINQNITGDTADSGAAGQDARIASYTAPYNTDDVVDTDRADDVTTDLETEENL